MACYVICVMEIPQKCQNLTFVEITLFQFFLPSVNNVQAKQRKKNGLNGLQ